ncbi:MAG: gamma-glutamylcyclotransferase family protein [Myxococcaceae bacterium]
MSDLYFAYGSNMSAARIRERCPSAASRGAGQLRGHSLRFHKRSRDGTGKANAFATNNADDAVFGVLFELSTEDLRQLDSFEGRDYQRLEREVERPDGARGAAWVYVAKSEAIDEQLKPSPAYLGHVLRGAREHDLPGEYRSRLWETPSTAPAGHRTLLHAFHTINDSNALGWIALDTKVERFALAAIATEINRSSGRVAHLELLRMDLVILEASLAAAPKRRLDARNAQIKMRYEAKGGQLFDFAPEQGTQLEYLGGELNNDLLKLEQGRGAGLFFLVEAEDPSRHLKYYKGLRCTIDDAVSVLQKNVSNGVLVASETIDCGLVDGTLVKIHLCVFDRK